MDEVGVGYGLAERINREISARIKGYSWNASNKTEAFELFKTDALSRKIGFPRKYEEAIKAEIKMVTKIVTPDGKTKYTAARNSLGHGDLVSGMILAHQAWRDMPMNASVPAPVPFSSAFGGFCGSAF